MRPSKRKPDQPREIKFTRNYTKHAAGSVLAEFGDTKVICSATIATGVPKFLKGSNQAWLTAEYADIISRYLFPSTSHKYTPFPLLRTIGKGE